MPSPEQQQTLYDLSDDELYPGAVKFLHRLIDEKECRPLPASQVAGLLNITNNSSYTELERFIRHQLGRDWSESKKDVQIFYTQLDKEFTQMKKTLLPRFHLEQEGKNAREVNDELMALLARDFIQHLLAENLLLLAARANERAKRR
jgi:hypothetical protein